MNPDDDSRGPLRVAMEYNHNAKVQVKSILQSVLQIWTS